MLEKPHDQADPHLNYRLDKNETKDETRVLVLPLQIRPTIRIPFSTLTGRNSPEKGPLVFYATCMGVPGQQGNQFYVLLSFKSYLISFRKNLKTLKLIINHKYQEKLSTYHSYIIN